MNHEMRSFKQFILHPSYFFLKQHGPVVQRLRLLAYTQATAVRFRPGLFRAGDWGLGAG